MFNRPLLQALTCLTLSASAALQAQGLRAPTAAPAAGPGLSAPSTAATPVRTQRSADFIVAVVNTEPITNAEVNLRLTRLLQQQRRSTDPSERSQLARQVLERLIVEKVQLQWAQEVGVRVDDAALEQAERSVARQNQIDLPEMQRRLQADGISLTQFRNDLRTQLLLNRLREREVDLRVKVSDLEVEQALREPATVVDPNQQEINLAQLLVAVPETATPELERSLRQRAQTALERARAGEDFGQLVRELSNGPERSSGGVMGLRPAGRYPELFIQATQKTPVGGISEVLRSGAGWHILKVLERPGPSPAGLGTVVQSRASHILLRPGPKLDEAAALARLADFRKRLLAGQADFAALAREHSQDGSAKDGGDLGWAVPGQFVPEFENVMNALAPGQVSEPLVSRFGVHLVRLQERREVALSGRERFEQTRIELRERKQDEAYTRWLQDLRGRAYIEYREPPQ